ncbi:hypothetical protein JCM9152_2479 [Halalkalibacter hemicellulosilyticusJCM 9152]|uniref:Uncharacterized protein n=1 Tax=Halalkalibacter hemicellulosilyticusJCM 9152 TaxID=1236971 RepID=W4QG38_9BACI|nr:hypothetical protein JCM9152_2479 [Halalkalibacter hemicellulosilyticusJCM 9152]
MTTTKESVSSHAGISNPAIFGANVSFLVLAILTLFTFVLAFFIKYDKPAHINDEDELNEKASEES